MKLTRRNFMVFGAGALAFAGTLPFVPKAIAATKADDAIAAFTGGAEVKEGRISLSTPEIA